MPSSVQQKKIRLCSPFFQYKGSIFWLVLITIIFFPLALFLLIKNTHKVSNNRHQYFEYYGRWGWVYFWAILFFPLAFVLLFFNGISLVTEETENIVSGDGSTDSSNETQNFACEHMEHDVIIRKGQKYDQ